MPLLNKLTPGVYIDEADGGARPISTPGTAVLAVVGLVRKEFYVPDPDNPDDETKKTPKTSPVTPTLVTSWRQFTENFGGLDQGVLYTHEAMWAFFLNGGAVAYVVGIPATVNRTNGQVKGQLPYFGRLLTQTNEPTLNITSKPLDTGDELAVEIRKASDPNVPDAFDVVVQRKGAPEKVVPNVSLGTGKGVRNVKQVVERDTEGLLTIDILDSALPLAERTPVVGSRVELKATASPAAIVKEIELERKAIDLFRGDVAARKGIQGLEAIEEVTMVIAPDVMGLREKNMLSDEEVKQIHSEMLAHCENMKDRFAIFDSPRGLNVQQMKDWRLNTTTWNLSSKRGFGGLYYPWVKANGKYMPPSGFVAGVYSRVDTTRGVHKAPANETVVGAVDLELNVTHNEQGLLNPIGVNVIRSFPGRGILIWGARTIADAASEWRYINVRRLFSNIEEAIFQGTQWTVFEPNDRALWAGIRREVSAYLTLRWREGALFGATPEDAFYVICDETINTEAVRDLGYCLVEVGIAPVKPAEFVVFTVRQKREGASGVAE